MICDTTKNGNKFFIYFNDKAGDDLDISDANLTQDII